MLLKSNKLPPVNRHITQLKNRWTRFNIDIRATLLVSNNRPNEFYKHQHHDMQCMNLYSFRTSLRGRRGIEARNHLRNKARVALVLESDSLKVTALELWCKTQVL
jgi:hypothetical protein